MNLETAVDLAIDNIIKEGLTDIFSIDFDVSLLKEDNEGKKIIRDYVLSKLKQRHINHLDVNPIQHILIPKSGIPYDFRRAALLSPLCTINLLALSIYVAPQIEQRKIPVERGVVFSYRFEPKDGYLFRQDCGYSRWMEEYLKRKNEDQCKVIVKCDIASFYDRSNLHRLKSTLEYIGVEDWVCNIINELLMFWSKRDSYGLPIGSNGSRILAEAVLLDVDEYLDSNGVQFIRFVDDYRMFAPDLPIAQRWLAMLTTRLFRDGMMLNASKTKVIDKKAIDQIKEDVAKKDHHPETVLKTITTKSRYNKVVRRFQMPANDKLQNFKEINIKEGMKNIVSNEVVEFEEFQKVVLAILIQQKYDYLEEIEEFIKRCIYGIDYLIDMLKKNKNDIPEQTRKVISDKLGKLLELDFVNGLDWYYSRIIEILGTDGFSNKAALIKVISERTKESSSLPTIRALEGVADYVTRSDVRTIRELYDKCDEWEKRRIMYIVSKSLPEEERKAWFKAISKSCQSDIFTSVAFNKFHQGV